MLQNQHQRVAAFTSTVIEFKRSKCQLEVADAEENALAKGRQNIQSARNDHEIVGRE